MPKRLLEPESEDEGEDLAISVEEDDEELEDDEEDDEEEEETEYEEGEGSEDVDDSSYEELDEDEMATRIEELQIEVVQLRSLIKEMSRKNNYEAVGKAFTEFLKQQRQN